MIRYIVKRLAYAVLTLFVLITLTFFLMRMLQADPFIGDKTLSPTTLANLNAKYGPGTVEVALKDTYYNMRQIVSGRMDIVERAFAAYRAVGVEPLVSPIRGGTDGARLTFMGLPTPNIATGGMNFHGRFECVAVEDMDLMTDVLVHLITD